MLGPLLLAKSFKQEFSYNKSSLLVIRRLVLSFGYQNLNANLFTSAVDVYQVIFSVFRVYYVTFYT